MLLLSSHREKVGVKGAIVFSDKEGKHSGRTPQSRSQHHNGRPASLQLDTDPSKHAAWEETVSGERDKTTALHQGA